MANEVPTGDVAVFALLEMFALAFAFEGAAAFLHGEPWWRTILAWLVSVVFFVAGIKWPRIKQRVRPRFASSIDSIANDSRYRISATLIISACISGYILFQLYAVRRDIDAYVMPRIVTEQQADQISQALIGHDLNIPIDVFASSADHEAVEYAAQLSNAIKKGGWNARFGALNPWETGPAAKHNNGRFYNIYLALDEGVSLRVGFVGEPHNPDPKHPSPGDVLAEALRKAGINVGSGGAWNPEQYSLILEVGKRPATITSTSIKSKVGQWIMRHWIMAR